MKKRTLGLAALGFALVAGSALALDVAATIKARGTYFHGIGGNMRGLDRALKSPAPPKADLLKFAQTLDSEAPKLPALFPAGTGMDSGAKTSAKADIWLKADLFRTDAKAFAVAAHHLNEVAATGDLAAIREAQTALGGTCRTCHETFRKPDH